MKRIFELVCLAACMVGSALWAQEPAFSTEATEQCVFATPAPQDARGCIGMSANQCMQSPDGYTTVGMVACLNHERAYWDTQLNAVYQSLRAELRAADAELDELGSAAPRMEPALVAMQRAWIAFRDATCDYEASQWGGGSGTGPAVMGCMMRLTGEQTLYLGRSRLGQ